MNPRKETRFAVVLNGGVSLAVWMGGVTHELNRLRMASDAGPPPSDPKEAAVHAVWDRILRKCARQAVVDTIAGTSAGGLNGTFLATAIAGGKDLSVMRQVWSDVASVELGRLLSDSGEPPHSVLDGQFFHDQVRLLLDRLSVDAQVRAPQDCTLLVTATALDAVPVPIRLETGAPASMVDSRRVFKFERRTVVGSGDTDEPDNVLDNFSTSIPSIALAARASASFPGAFEPVRETEQLQAFRMRPSQQQEIPPEPWLIDGGVLDNAPFGPLMEVLRARPVGAPFERVVLYVTPSPGVTGPAEDLGEHPTAFRVLKRVGAAFREPDQRLDYEGLRDAFALMGYTRSTPHHAILQLFKSPDPGAFSDSIQATVEAQEWFQTYRSARAEAVERKLASLGTGIVFAIPDEPVLQPDQLYVVPADPTVTGQQWRWGVASAVRALRWWGRALVACSDDPEIPDEAVDAALAQVRLSQSVLAELERQLENQLEEQLAPEPAGAPGPADLDERVLSLNILMQGRQYQVRQAVEAAAEAIVTHLPQLQNIDRMSFINFTLAIEVASTVLSWGTGSEGDEPAFRYRQVTPAAQPLVDLGDELTGNPEWLNRKLYGERLGHFGAFLSKEDRLADWLWGRLDGASALCDCFLGDDPEAQDLRQELARAILAAEGSSEAELRAAARRAVATTSMGLLRDVKPTALLQGVRFLWHKTGVVVSRILQRADDSGSSGAPSTQNP